MAKTRPTRGRTTRTQTTGRRRFLRGAAGAAALTTLAGCGLGGGGGDQSKSATAAGGGGEMPNVSLKFQAGFPAKDPLFDIAQDFYRILSEISNGHIKVELMQSGTVVGAFDQADDEGLGQREAGGRGLAVARHELEPGGGRGARDVRECDRRAGEPLGRREGGLLARGRTQCALGGGLPVGAGDRAGGIDRAAAVGFDPRQRDAAGQLQGSQRPADAVVLQVGGDDVVAFLEHPLEGHIERVGAVEREDEALGRFAVEELVEHVAGVVQGVLGRQGHLVAGAARVSEVLAGEAVKGLVNGFGLGETGGGVIEVDHRGSVRGASFDAA